MRIEPPIWGFYAQFMVYNAPKARYNGKTAVRVKGIRRIP